MTEQEKQKLKDALIEHKNIATSEYDDEDAFVGIYFCDLVDIIDSVMDNTGWHSASELPIVPKGEDEVEVYCLVTGTGLTILVPMKLHYTVSRGFGVGKNIEIKWWCYPPKEE